MAIYTSHPIFLAQGKALCLPNVPHGKQVEVLARDGKKGIVGQNEEEPE